MDKQWIESAKVEQSKALLEIRQKMLNDFANCDLFNDGDRKIIEEELDKYIGNLRENEYAANEVLLHIEMADRLEKNHPEWSEEEGLAAYKHIGEVGGYKDLHRTIYLIEYGFDRYEDSEPMEFDGDIIITDPCYITKDETDDWSRCGYGTNLERLGIQNYMTRDTLYGDWGCTVYDTNTKEPIGKFCADAGMVSVLLLQEVLRYNPGFNYHTERTWTTTLIKNFKGTVQFVVEYEHGVFGEDSNFAGEEWEDYSVHVVGHGINKSTGERIDFRSTQSSL